MSDYIARLISRTILPPEIRPRLRPLYEPQAADEIGGEIASYDDSPVLAHAPTMTPMSRQGGRTDDDPAITMIRELPPTVAKLIPVSSNQEAPIDELMSPAPRPAPRSVAAQAPAATTLKAEQRTPTAAAAADTVVNAETRTRDNEPASQVASRSHNLLPTATAAHLGSSVETASGKQSEDLITQPRLDFAQPIPSRADEMVFQMADDSEPRFLRAKPETADGGATQPSAIRRGSRVGETAARFTPAPASPFGNSTQRALPAPPVNTLEEAPEPAIHVTIGRLEIRASVAQPAPAPKRVDVAQRTSSLEEYLRGRSKATRL